MGRILRDGSGLLLVAAGMALLFWAVTQLRVHDYVAATLLIVSGLSVVRAGAEICVRRSGSDAGVHDAPSYRTAMLALTLVIVAPVGGGCGADAERDDGRAPVPSAARAVPPSSLDDRVVSRVDGEAITVEEVEEIVRATGLTPLDALRRLEEERVLIRHAEAAELETAEAQGALDVRNAMERTAVQALLEERIEREITPGRFSAEDVQRRIDAQPQRFGRPERRRSTHVLAQLEGAEIPAEVDAAAERYARRAIERLRGATDPVAEARAMSGDDVPGRRFRIRVEELPAIERDGALAPEYLAALYGVEARGVVAAPVRTRFGWHAIVVTEIVPAWQAPRSEIEALVRNELTIEARARRLTELVAELAARTPIELYQPAIAAALEGAPDGDGAPR